MRIFRVVATMRRGAVAPAELLDAADQWEANLAQDRDERVGELTRVYWRRGMEPKPVEREYEPDARVRRMVELAGRGARRVG